MKRFHALSFALLALQSFETLVLIEASTKPGLGGLITNRKNSWFQRRNRISDSTVVGDNANNDEKDESGDNAEVELSPDEEISDDESVNADVVVETSEENEDKGDFEDAGKVEETEGIISEKNTTVSEPYTVEDKAVAKNELRELDNHLEKKLLKKDREAQIAFPWIWRKKSEAGEIEVQDDPTGKGADTDVSKDDGELKEEESKGDGELKEEEEESKDEGELKEEESKDEGSNRNVTDVQANFSRTSDASPIAPMNPAQFSSPATFGQSASPLFMYSSPSFVRPQTIMPQQNQPAPVEATLTSLVSALLPLITRVLMLSLLSGPSLLYGSGENSVYSPSPSQHFMLERLNDRYTKDGLALKKALEHAPINKSKHGWQWILSKRRKELRKELNLEDKLKGNSGNSKVTEDSNSTTVNGATFSRTVIVMDVDASGDVDGTISYLRDSVSFILSQYYDKTRSRLDMGKELEVVLCIESPGGIVQDFGLAADQIARLRRAGLERGDLTVTICVDRIAASGGYMMACQATPGQLLSAPFAVLGSIGVLRETINYHDVLQKYGIRPLLMKSGEAKSPLTAITNVTEESLAYVQKSLNSTHEAFSK